MSVARCTPCGRRWESLTQAHCNACHQHFGTDGLADKHRAGPMHDRRCVPPAEARAPKSGKPLYRSEPDRYGPVWRSYERRDMAAENARATQA